MQVCECGHYEFLTGAEVWRQEKEQLAKWRRAAMKLDQEEGSGGPESRNRIVNGYEVSHYLIQ